MQNHAHNASGEQRTANNHNPIREYLRNIELLRNFVMLVRILVQKRKNKFFWKKFLFLYENKNGLEVGGPSDIFAPIYRKCLSCDGVNFNSDTVWWTKGNLEGYKFADKTLGKIYIADAVNMNCIKDNNYDFVLSSNNLEHIANPLKALGEFKRVLKKDGTVTVLVPKKDCTFDHNRDFTRFEHILEDYKNNIGEDDLTHLPEILELHDYDLDPACGGKEAFTKRAELNFQNRCLHQHVFNEECLRKMFDFLDFTTIAFADYSSDYVIIGKK